MRRLLFLIGLLTILVMPLSVQSQETVDVMGVTVSCPDGPTIENGVEMIINMRAGFSYTATVLGIDGFDPVIAVTDGDTVLCNDDSTDAANYGVNLPTTGVVESSPFSARTPFSYSGGGFGDISIIVGSFDNRAGEFVLLIEGLAVTNADGRGEGAGDPFALRVTPNVHLSGVPTTAYMISVTSQLDPLMTVVDNNEEIIRFENGDLFACDDAGSAGLCWGESVSLDGFGVQRGNRSPLGGFSRDAYMSVPGDLLGLGPDQDAFLNWRYTSYEQNTFGDYIAVFHVGTTAAGPMEVDGVGESETTGGPLSVTDALNDDQPQAIYRFNGSAGDVVTITMIADEESDLDPNIALFTASGFDNDDDPIADNDDAQDQSIGSFNSQIPDFELPEDGEYIIVASRFEGTSGNFTLTVEGATGGSDGGDRPPSGTLFEAPGLGIGFAHPEDWTVIEGEPTLIIATDDMATLENLSADDIEFSEGQFVLAVSNLENLELSADSLIEANEAVINNLDEGDTTDGPSEATRLGNNDVIKTDMLIQGLDGLLYVVGVNDNIIVVQIVADDVEEFGNTFDNLVGSIRPLRR